MIYYILGLITSTIVFSVFLAALRSPVNSQYVWTALFSLTLLSAATTLIFLIGLVLRLVEATRQRNQTTRPEQSRRNLPSPGHIPLSRSDFARRWIASYDAPSEEVSQDVTYDGVAIRQWLKSEIEKRAPEKTKPDTHQMPGFKSIKRH